MRLGNVVTLGTMVVLASACATTRSNTPITDPDLITEDQIVRSKATNAYDVIATISPKMFTAHGAATTRGDQPPTVGRQALPVIVYIDNVKVGPVDELKTLGKVDLKEIRYLSPRAATDRWGEGHPGGVIAVTTIQGVGPDTTSRETGGGNRGNGEPGTVTPRGASVPGSPFPGSHFFPSPVSRFPAVTP